MDLGLNNRVAVVMAASRGLGKATAKALAAEGCKLALCSRDASSIERTAMEIGEACHVQVLARSVDVTKPAEIADFAAAVEREYGSVDILVNNSGGPTPGSFDTLDEAAFARATDLLLMNVVRTTKAFLPLIRRTGRGGRIINLTSTSVREVLPNLMLSNSLRAAVSGWSKSLARELGPENILVNCVAPGTIQTERIDTLVAANAARQSKTPEEIRAAMVGRIPLGRFGKPEELAAAVAFLAGAGAGYISGITLYVDGATMSSVI